MQAIVTTGLMASFVLSGTTTAELRNTQKDLPPEPAAKVIEIHTVSLTGYNAVPEQTDDDPFTTASGAYSNPEVVVARSVDLKDKLPFGTVVKFSVPEDGTKAPCGLSSVEHLVGYRVVADSMHPRKRNQMDILFDAGKTVTVGQKKVNPAIALGVCKNIDMEVVGRIDVRNMPKNQTELAALIGEASFAVNQ